MPTCPKPNCNYEITLRVSRGTADSDNRGYWYEVCTAPVPGTSHFIKWRRDMGRQEITAFPGPSSPPVGGFQTFQSILEAMAPVTPVQTPARRDRDRNVLLKSAYNTPSKRPSLSASSLANPINTVQHSLSLAEVLNVPSETDSETHPTASESQSPEPDATPISTVVNHPGPPADLLPPADSEPAHTRIVAKGGKSFVSCNGPICRSNPSKDPVRNCRSCTHSFCKKCCIQFQKDGAIQCAHPAHHFDKGDDPTLPSTVDNFSTSEYNVKRPLRKDHYEARENAQQKWEIKANNLIQKRVAEDSLRSNVKIIYWKNESDEPDVIDIPCPTFPFFTLDSCSVATLKVLGIEKGPAERPDLLIDTFNPFDGTNGRWNKHTLSTSRNVSKFQVLLYRAPNVSSTAVDMKSEIDNLVEMLKPRKRIADSDPSESPRPSKRRILDAVENNQSPRKAIKLEPITVETSSDSDSSPEFPSPAQLIPEILTSKTVTVRLAKTKHASKKAVHSSIRTKKIVELPSGSDSEDESVRATQASSLHASWPLKYVRSMAEGFAKMETMSTGTLPERFRSSFGLSFPSSKATWSTHSNIWNAAASWQRQEFIDAGYTEHGLWKTFARDVRERYPDGKVPGKRSNNKRKGKGKSTGKTVHVKKEDRPIKIKAEPSSEDIIVIDSSDDDSE